MITPSFWTPDRLHQLTDLRGAGMSFRRIAAIMGGSGEAMRYRCDFLGLPRFVAKGEPQTTWTKEADALLAVLWADRSIYCDEIAAELSEQTGKRLTKNAIIGRARRIDLPRRTRSRLESLQIATRRWKELHARDQKTRLPKIHRQKAVTPKSLANTKTAVNTLPMVQPVFAAPKTPPIRFDERLPFQCSWIEGEPSGPDIMCCGAPVVRKSWCAHHVERGFQPAPKRSRRIPTLSTLSLSGAFG